MKIFNIQRFSVYDGPGIRTAVFSAGCNLRCGWCHNPESVSGAQQLKFNADQCILCGRCFDLCEKKAHGLCGGLHTINRNVCEVCLNCTKECYAEALVPVCREVNAAELEKSIITDEEYFKHSGGGVTFTGGEPMLQICDLEEILKICKNRGIHTAVDTAGAVDFGSFEKIIPYCDLFLYDIKTFDGALHKKLTGQSNELILENLKKLSEISKTGGNFKLWVRIPVVGGANADIGEMTKIAGFLSGLNIDKCEFMAYHKLGEGKYKSLGLTAADSFKTPPPEFIEDIKNIFGRENIKI